MDNLIKDKTFVITGVTSGIGLAVAEGLVETGASILGVGRSPQRCRLIEGHLRSLHSDEKKVVVLVAELSIQANIRILSQEIARQLSAWGKTGLDGLINNAGTVPFWQTYTPEGFDTQWAVNHLAPFLLTHELLPALKAAGQARIITVSSGSHYHTRLNWQDIQLRRHYNPLLAYKQTKLANVLFTAELNRQMGAGSNVLAFAADPGLVNTELGLKSNSAIARWIWELRRRGGISAAESAKGIIYLAVDPAIRDSRHIYWKHGRPQKPSPYALEPEPARRLWEISSRMCALDCGI